MRPMVSAVQNIYIDVDHVEDGTAHGNEEYSQSSSVDPRTTMVNPVDMEVIL